MVVLLAYAPLALIFIALLIIMGGVSMYNHPENAVETVSAGDPIAATPRKLRSIRTEALGIVGAGACALVGAILWQVHVIH